MDVEILFSGNKPIPWWSQNHCIFWFFVWELFLLSPSCFFPQSVAVFLSLLHYFPVPSSASCHCLWHLLYLWLLCNPYSLVCSLFSCYSLGSKNLFLGKPSLTLEPLLPFLGLFWSVLFGSFAGSALMSHEHLHNVSECIKQCDLMPVMYGSFSQVFFCMTSCLCGKGGKK